MTGTESDAVLKKKFRKIPIVSEVKVLFNIRSQIRFSVLFSIFEFRALFCSISFYLSLEKKYRQNGRNNK